MSDGAYWAMGWHAWVDGKGVTSCPFPSGSARDDWMRGYDEARAKLSALSSASQ